MHVVYYSDNQNKKPEMSNLPSNCTDKSSRHIVRLNFNGINYAENGEKRKSIISTSTPQQHQNIHLVFIFFFSLRILKERQPWDSCQKCDNHQNAFNFIWALYGASSCITFNTQRDTIGLYNEYRNLRLMQWFHSVFVSCYKMHVGLSFLTFAVPILSFLNISSCSITVLNAGVSWNDKMRMIYRMFIYNVW